jgi:hypothetical protein
MTKNAIQPLSIIAKVFVLLLLCVLNNQAFAKASSKSQIVVIKEAAVNFGIDEILVLVDGLDLAPGPLQVTLGDLGDISSLCTEDLLATPPTVQCDFSLGGLPVDGDYLLGISGGTNSKYVDLFDLTIVAAGPTGPEGPQGPDGPQGPAGPAGGILAYAHVNADATINNDSGNITVSSTSPGMYCVGVTGGTVHVAVVSQDSRQNQGGYVQASVIRASGCVASGNDDIRVVTRNLSQDGGFPGTAKAFYIIVN